MNKNIFISLAMVCAVMAGDNLFAQQREVGKGTISGAVQDADLQVYLPFVSVAVLADESKTTVAGHITNEQGHFEITGIPEGTFVVNIQFMGYETEVRKVFISPEQMKVDLGTVLMKEDVALLNAVVVTAERSTIEQKIDRKVINIGKDLSTVGPTAADLMVNLPTVDVDQNGNVSMRGNENVVVLVDGKPTNQNAAQLLQQIPSGSIKSIELITNPSAKYVPEGMSGIINIVLHKNITKGFNAGINNGLTLGKKVRYNTATDLNYRTKRANYYLTYGFTDAPRPTWGEITRPDEPSDEDWYALNDRITHLLKMGLDINLADRTVFSFYSIQNSFANQALRTTDISFPFTPILNFGQAYETDVRNYASNFNFDLKHQFSEASSLELELDRGTFEGEEAADFHFYGTAFEVDQAEELITNERDLTTINVDFESNLTSASKLEAGLEARLQQIVNHYDTSNPNFVSSSYGLNRDIYAAYVNFRQQLNKWSYQLGARFERFEQTIEFHAEGSEAVAFNDFIQTVYPTLFISYKPNPETEADVFNVSVSRRVDRPNLLQLNPMRAWSSARITNVGNPSLIPQFTNSIEFNYTRQLATGSLTSGIFLRKIYDEITRFGFNDLENPGGILFSYDNYQDNSAYGFELSGNYQLLPEWSFNASVDVYAQNQRGVAQEQFREVQNVIANVRMNHSFKVTRQLTLQIIGLYRGASTNLQYRTLSFYFLNAGARYKLFGGNGNLNLSFNDIFRTQRFAFEGERPTLQEGTFNWDSRAFFIGYSHQFGQGRKFSPKRKKRDANEKKSVGGF